MIQFKKISIVLPVIILAAVISIVTQSYMSVHAVETISGNDNETINVKTTDGLPVNINVQDYSVDGNVILFTSSSTNLINSGSSSSGLYIYDIKQDTTKRVDVSSSGIKADNSPLYRNYKSFRLSETGRYVLFQSIASNLIDGSSNTAPAFYKRDTQLEITSRVSQAATSTSSQNWDYNLGISNDGRFSLISSRYIMPSFPYPFKISLKDNATNSWTSLADSGYSDPENSYSSEKNSGGMSCDGSFATYIQTGSVMLADLRRGVSNVISVGGNMSQSPLISCNGRYILYATTNRTNIAPTPSGLNSNYHLVRYDRILESRMYIDSNSLGVFSTGSPILAGAPAINSFSASVANTGDVVFKYGSNVYIKHLSDGSGNLESIAKNSTGTSIDVQNGEITGDGRYVFFSTDPYNLGLTSTPSSSQLIRTKTNL